ncbi:MAG: amidohydrolase [Pseudomonadota bacterium]
MSIRRFCFAAATLFAVSCASDKIPDMDAGLSPERADVTIFTGGPIYTGDEENPTVEAVAVANGAIVAVGTRDIVERGASGDVAIVDLEGAAMYPGFTDAHAHLIGIGMRELTLNLEGVSSVAELVSIVAANAQRAGDGETVYGRGWIETGWPEERMPNRIDLDPVSRNNPVVLYRADGHAAVVNSAALEKAGIDDTTRDPDGGRIDRDQYGRATGILIDKAMGLVAGLVEAPSSAQKREAYEKGSEVYAAYGWTGLHNMSVDPADVSIMEDLSADGALDIRVYNALDRAGFDMLEASGPRASDNVKIITRTIKLYADGALGSRGALLADPYSDAPDTSGLLLLPEEAAKDYLNRAIPAGIQIVTHAIGDRGNTLVLDWYEETFAQNQDAGDLRWRIEHAQILDTDDIPRFAALGVIPSMQPSHAIGDLFFAPDRLGRDRLDGAYAWRALIDAGAIIAGGSDAPVERGDPLIEFYAAVARRGLDGTQTQDWRPAQAVTREEALKMFTAWPAHASFQEGLLGTIAPGKRADFTVFSKDIMTVPEAEILTAKPVMTVIDGEIVFRSGE